MLKKIDKSRLFIIRMVAVFITVYLFYQLVLLPYTQLDNQIILSLLDWSNEILKILNYNSFADYTTKTVGIIGTSGVLIGNPCDGLSLFLLFSAFILAFKGKWWFKLIYIILGCTLIHLLNGLRIAMLAIIYKNSPEWLDFHHSYTFTLIIYAIIFSLWMLKVRIYVKRGY